MQTFVFTHKTDKKAKPQTVFARNLESARVKLANSHEYEHKPEGLKKPESEIQSNVE